MPHFSHQFAWNHFNQLRYRNISALRAKLENRGRLVVCWGIRDLTRASLQSTPVPSAMPNPSDVPVAKRSIFLVMRNKTAVTHYSLVVDKQPLSHLKAMAKAAPPHHTQQDSNPQGPSLPLCPPASPQSLLPDAPLLSGSESVDPGLAAVLKITHVGGEPWTPPAAQPGCWVLQSHRAQGSCG